VKRNLTVFQIVLILICLVIIIYLPILLLVPIYFIPSFVADYRDHQSKMGITALNLFLGWTFLGWVISLVWALSSVEKR